MECKNCGASYEPKRNWQIYCGPRCAKSVQNARYHYRHPRDRREYHVEYRKKLKREGRCMRCGCDHLAPNSVLCLDCLDHGSRK